MPVTITAAQRDAIYELVISGLADIGRVWTFVEADNFAAAQAAGREVADDLRLLDELAWGPTIEGQTVELTLSHAVLTRALARLHSDTVGALDVYVSRPRVDEALAQRDLATADALTQILARLATPGEESER